MRWLPYVYQYGIMMIFFTIGTAIVIKNGQLRLNTKQGKRYFVLLISGLIGYMVLQGFLQFIAPLI
jgi:hypothetical protein